MCMNSLKEWGLEIRESEAPDRLPIDFSICDSEDNVAWVWGKNEDDLEWECTHPFVEYDDDESVGECPVCGATCDWHYETSADDGYVIKERVPHEWHNQYGGIIKQYIKEK